MYINNNRVTKKYVQSLIGKGMLERLIKENKEIWLKDKYTQLDNYIGKYGILGFEFEV